MTNSSDNTATDNPNVRLTEGQPAPDFALTADNGDTVKLSDFKGKKVLVYFYPKADTPGCTKEACDFRDSLTQLNDHNVDVVGISPDRSRRSRSSATSTSSPSRCCPTRISPS